MSLTFQREIKILIAEHLMGIDRIKKIDKAISANGLWKQEAFQHVKKLLHHMAGRRASDMDMGGYRANQRIWYRVYGHKAPDLGMPSYTVDEINAMALCLLTEEQKSLLYDDRNLDFALSLRMNETESPYRFRGNVYFERGCLAVNFRLINQELFTLNSLEIPKQIVKRLDLNFEKSGLVLITGITGSGKSSTLDTIIDMNNHNNHSHIVIIGNPIEFIHRSDKSIVCHRELGEDCLSFAHGAIEALRQDPDIIVVGEMRDRKTIGTVLEVTDSGHKVFSTLHTSSTIESIHRIIAEFPPDEQERVRFRLADVLRVVISQKLVPNKQGNLSLAKEILSVDSSVQAAIRNNNIAEIFQMLTEGKTKGMFTMQQDLYRLYKLGRITAETAMNFSNNTKVMANLIKYAHA